MLAVFINPHVRNHPLHGWASQQMDCQCSVMHNSSDGQHPNVSVEARAVPPRSDRASSPDHQKSGRRPRTGQRLRAGRPRSLLVDAPVLVPIARLRSSRRAAVSGVGDRLDEEVDVRPAGGLEEPRRLTAVSPGVCKPRWPGWWAALHRLEFLGEFGSARRRLLTSGSKSVSRVTTLDPRRGRRDLLRFGRHDLPFKPTASGRWRSSTARSRFPCRMIDASR